MALSNDGVRLRRRVMHNITRTLSKGDPHKKAAFDAHFKDLVHSSLTKVIREEEEELARWENEGGK